MSPFRCQVVRLAFLAGADLCAEAIILYGGENRRALRGGRRFSGLTDAGGESRIPHVRRHRVISSEEERFPDTEEVTSSILVSPTIVVHTPR